MPPSRDDIRDLNTKIVESYWEGQSVPDLAKTYGRSVSTIHKLVNADRMANGPRKRVAKADDPRIMVNKKALSKRHSWIGIQIARYAAEHDLTPTKMGLQINVSRVVVRNMEVGAHDFTLGQLYTLSSVLGVDFDTLITPALPKEKT
jgi:hypothetical protein